MKAQPRRLPSPLLVGLAALFLFATPMALFLHKFPVDAPFYFLAEDSFYYLSIALHSLHSPFFTLDGLHPTNGFHPLWECFEYTLAKLPYFRLDGPNALPRLFAVNLALVSLAIALLSAWLYRLTRRPWLSLLALCPGLLWFVAGIGAPAYLNPWAFVNGMETALELLFFALALHLLGAQLRSGTAYTLGVATLGLLVLSRLDDIFFLLSIALVAAWQAPRADRLRRLAPFLLPLLLLAAYLLYNHHTVGIWMPVSGMAKAGKGYRAGIGESLRLLKGWPFFALAPNAIAFFFSNVYVMVAQMLAPMAIAAAWLVWSPRHSQTPASPLLQSLALGVLLKGSYNFLRVPVGYQGAWYYGVSTVTANILLALFLAEALHRWTAAASHTTAWPPALTLLLRLAALAALTFVSFNIVAARASQNGFAAKRDAYTQRATLTAALRAATHAPFLEFQDGELSFLTGLPAISGFGLAADPAAVRAQHDGAFFPLLAARGVTIAAASNTYPIALAASDRSKAIFPIWGFNPQEIQNYCFQPFWSDPVGNIVLYHIRHQPLCPPTSPPTTEH